MLSCKGNQWLCGKVLALYSVVTGSVSSVEITVYTSDKPNKVETAVQFFRMSHAVFTGFSDHSNSVYIIK